MKNWIDDPLLFDAAEASFLFRGKPKIEIRELLRDSELMRFKKGECMSSPRLGIILKGEAEVLCIHADSRVLLNRIFASGSFGAASLFSEHEENVLRTEVIAVKPCTVIYIGADRLEEMLRADFTLTQNYIAFLSGRIRFLNHRITGFTVGTANSRLAAYLVENADAEGRVTLPRSMTALASALDIGRSSLYRSIDALTASGAVARDGAGLRIINMEAIAPAPKGHENSAEEINCSPD